MVHPNRREIPGGIPPLIDAMTYERAQEKLKTNKADNWQTSAWMRRADPLTALGADPKDEHFD